MDKPKPALPPAHYTNFLSVVPQRSEFFLAFGQVPPGQMEAHAVACLVTSPEQAKAMLGVLRQAVERYEDRFGALPEPAPPSQPQRPAAARAEPPRSRRS